MRNTQNKTFSWITIMIENVSFYRYNTEINRVKITYKYIVQTKNNKKSEQ